jgi:HlyD family secretion protein
VKTGFKTEYLTSKSQTGRLFVPLPDEYHFQVILKLRRNEKRTIRSARKKQENSENIMKNSDKVAQQAQHTSNTDTDGITDRSSKKISRLPWIVSSLILAAIILIIVIASNKEPEVPAPPVTKLTNVEVLTIDTEGYTESLTLPAIVEADRVVDIKPEFAGLLKRWLYPEGAQVELGDVIAEIDTESLRLNQEELEAALMSASQNVTLSNITKEKAEVNLANMKKDVRLKEVTLESAESSLDLVNKQFNRVKRMAGQKIATDAQLDDAKNSLTQAELSVVGAKQGVNSAILNIEIAKLAIKEAEAGIQLAEARIAELEASIHLLEYRIEKGKLKAPFSGVLEAHLVEAGEMVSPGVSIARIYDLKNLRATIDVPDRYITFLDSKNKETKDLFKMNMPGAVQQIKTKIIIPGLPGLSSGLESGVELDAQIARIAQSSDQESNTFKIELRFPNPGNALKHGLIARSKIEYLYYPEAIIIPVKAIQVTDAGPKVFIVESRDDHLVSAVRDIEPVSIHGSRTFIRKGLKKNDRLIIAGWKGLVGGEKIHILVEDGIFKNPN